MGVCMCVHVYMCTRVYTIIMYIYNYYYITIYIMYNVCAYVHNKCNMYGTYIYTVYIIITLNIHIFLVICAGRSCRN